MLVLSRHISEDIVLVTSDGLVSVMVVDVIGSKVRLGIEAPKTMQVHRREVYNEIANNDPGRLNLPTK